MIIDQLSVPLPTALLLTSSMSNMPKMKTRKSVAKRFKITSKKKVLRRASRQNHFNARQDSNQKRAKRSDKQVSGKAAKNILSEV